MTDENKTNNDYNLLLLKNIELQEKNAINIQKVIDVLEEKIELTDKLRKSKIEALTFLEQLQIAVATLSALRERESLPYNDILIIDNALSRIVDLGKNENL